MQVAVTSGLDGEKHIWLKSLASSLTGSEASRIVHEANGLALEEDRRNAEAVVYAASYEDADLFKYLSGWQKRARIWRRSGNGWLHLDWGYFGWNVEKTGKNKNRLL